MASSALASPPKKIAARAGLIALDEEIISVFRDCFRQFGIEVATLSADPGDRLQREKFDACVLNLDEQANKVLEAARQSPSNRRMIIFGLCNGGADAMRFSRYGLNVLLAKPLDRQAVLRAVRSTHLLIHNEFRRYVRIPLVIEVEGDSGKGPFKGNTVEFSAGGMSLQYKEISSLRNGDEVNVSFILPKQKRLTVQSSVCWIRPSEAMIGVRFSSNDNGRLAVKKWIEQYLDLSQT